MCSRKSYSIDDQSISGYGVPAYGNSFEFTPHWVKSNGKWYYRVSDCQNAHGWLLLNKKWYYLNESGEMLTGPQTIKSEVYGEELYYFMESGEEEGALCSTDERGSLHIWIDDK